jgi:AraC-like DNA-binding protein
MTRVLRDLGRLGVVAPSLADGLVLAEDAQLVARWRGACQFYAEFSVSTMLRKIAMALSLSARQTTREVAELTTTFDMAGLGLREAGRLMRLRGAAILLSAPDGTATEVARVLGYRSLTALGTTFRNAGLPPPSEVRAALLAGPASGR